MQAGRLRHRVIFQMPVREQDAGGEMIDDWVTVIENVPAEVLEIKGREFLSSREIHAEIDVKINIRYYDGFKPTWRILFGDRILMVKHIIDLQGRRRFQQLMCLEVVT